jgi:hypothetical protein
MTFVNMGMLLVENLAAVMLISEFEYHPRMITIVMLSADIRRPSTIIKKVWTAMIAFLIIPSVRCSI